MLLQDVTNVHVRGNSPYVEIPSYIQIDIRNVHVIQLSPLKFTRTQFQGVIVYLSIHTCLQGTTNISLYIDAPIR